MGQGRMRLRAVEGCAGATLLLAATLGSAAAQTIRHEVNGRAHTYEFKQPVQDGVPPDRRRSPAKGAGKSRALMAELPRGTKNIPWDEPGRGGGLPGVHKNDRTSLPVRPRRAKRPLSAERSRAVSGVEGAEVPVGKRAGTETEIPKSRVEGADDPPLSGHQMDATGAAILMRGHTLAPRQEDALDEGRAKARADEAEARAKMIAEARDRALAQEQRRLEIERKRDRARPQEPLSAPDPSNPALPPLLQQEPASTGSIGAGRASHTAAMSGGDPNGAQTPAGGAPLPVDPTSAPSGSPTWKDGVCRLLFFGAVKGC